MTRPPNPRFQPTRPSALEIFPTGDSYATVLQRQGRGEAGHLGRRNANLRHILCEAVAQRRPDRMLEVRMTRGVSSQMHMHAHESLLYVISGSLKTVIAGQALLVRQGEACRHPENVMHSVEALEDALFVEVKAPVPELQATLGISDELAAA